MIEFNISDISAHQEVAKSLLNFADTNRVFLFDAPMGSGKTTFIKTLCKQLNYHQETSSPTYSIVNEYLTLDNKRIYHFDLYRLKSSEELFDIGFDDYLKTGDYIFIEWPELAMPYLDKYLRILIKTENNNRYLSAEIISNYE